MIDVVSNEISHIELALRDTLRDTIRDNNFQFVLHASIIFFYHEKRVITAP